MESKTIDRKEFLTSTSKYAVGAAIGAVGMSSLFGSAIQASPKNATWPWPYIAIDPEAARLKAHNLYWTDKDCAAGVFGAFTELLKEKMPDPWTGMPMEVLLFGRGGGNGWGTLCGAVNGAAAIISLVATKADSGKLINEIWGWASTEKLPSDKANQTSIDGKYIDKKYNGALPQTISGSVICHASVSQWCNAANKKVSDVERKERCARLAGDIAAKTAEILNSHFASQFVSTYSTNSNAAQCLTCHGPSFKNNVQTQMDCKPCHGDPHATSGIAHEDSFIPSAFSLEQNYPNPFNPSTKIQFSIPMSQKVCMAIYDITGQEVNRLINYELLSPGKYTLDWNGMDNKGNKVTSGVYIGRLIAGTYMKSIKMNLVK